MAMNFIGSKRSLITKIETVLRRYDVPLTGKAVDLFSGSGVVSRLLKQMGYQVLANDWQAFSAALVSAAIMHDVFPIFHDLWESGEVSHTDVLAYLNKLSPKEGPFVEAYGEGGAADRLYFSHDNAMRIQAIRDQIASWESDGKLSPEHFQWLLAVLVEAADAVANTASVYGAYLKALKPTACSPLVLKPIYPTPGPVAGHQVRCEDAVSLLSQLPEGAQTLIYADPPYNERQYSANYHIPETLVRWDFESFIPRGKTGLRPQMDQRSDYCLGREAKRAFYALFHAARPAYWLVSYSNEGIVPKNELIQAMPAGYTLIADEEIDYPRFRSDRVSENRQYLASRTLEYLLLFSKST
jgi:adenine-specific DNA-methyltransferase